MKGFLKKILGFSLGPFAVALLGIILVPIITRFISPEEYGKTGMFLVAQGLISAIMYMGMDQAFAREFSAAKGSRDDLMVNAMLLPLAISVVLGIGMILLRDWVSYLLFGNEEEGTAIFLMALMFPFMVVEQFGFLKLRFEEKGFLYSFFCILLKVWTLILCVVLLVTYQRSFRSVVYGMALAEILNGIVLAAVSFRNFHPSRGCIQADRIKSLLKFALPLIPATMISWLLTSMDKVMLRSLCTYDELGLYTAAAKIVNALGIIQTCFTTIWMPIAFRWHEEGKARKYFELVMKLVAAGMSCICFGILMCKDLVGWFLGEDFVRAIGVFPFLMLQPIMYTMSETTTLGIAFNRKTGYNIVVSLLSGFTNLVLNYFLIPIFGGVGAALATGISYVVFFAVRTWISRRLWYKFPVGIFFVCGIMACANCDAHTFMDGVFPYALSAISVILMIVIVLPQIIQAIKYIRR